MAENGVKKATILIVDDEKIYLDVLIGILNPEYRILLARSGEEALRRLQGWQPTRSHSA